MPAPSHTLYTLALFFALVSLKLWSDRRHPLPRASRAAVRPLSRDV